MNFVKHQPQPISSSEMEEALQNGGQIGPDVSPNVVEALRNADPFPMLAAHRGATLFYQQNTMKAILKAFEQDFKMVNIDLRACKDDVYLSHDESNYLVDIGSEDPGAEGTLTNTDAMTRAQLSEKLFSTRANYNPGVTYAEPQPVVFLDDLFECLRVHPDKFLWIDLKGTQFPSISKCCCWLAFCSGCGSCCGGCCNGVANSLSTRVVEAMDQLPQSERNRIIVSSTNPILTIDWIKLARQKGWTKEMLGYGFDYGDQKRCCIIPPPTMCLERIFGATSVSMALSSWTDSAFATYKKNGVKRLAFGATSDGQDITPDNLPSVFLGDVYAVLA